MKPDPALYGWWPTDPTWFDLLILRIFAPSTYRREIQRLRDRDEALKEIPTEVEVVDLD